MCGERLVGEDVIFCKQRVYEQKKVKKGLSQTDKFYQVRPGLCPETLQVSGVSFKRIFCGLSNNTRHAGTELFLYGYLSLQTLFEGSLK